MGKGDILIPRPTGIHIPTASIASLRALDTTSASNYPDGWIIVVKLSPDHVTYIFHRSETGVDDADLIIDPTTGPGIWRKLETGSTIIIDSVPTDGSSNAVSSNGVFDALVTKLSLVTGGVIDDSSGFLTEVVPGMVEITHSGGQVTTINGQSITTSYASFLTHVLTDGATITPNFILSQNNKVTLAGNRVLATPSSYDDDVDVTLEILQDATGSRTLTFSADYVFPTGFDTGLNSTANDRTLFTFKTDTLLGKLIYKSGGKSQASGGGTVTSVSGTANRITSTGGTTPVLDISSSYVGQVSIVMTGVITTGTWNATVVSTTYGGTGLSTIGTANQLLRVNSGATALEYFTPTYITGNQSITLSGDASGSGTTAITVTLATVNSNIGTFNNITVNAKGLVTAASNVAYLTANQTITLSGDVTGSGTTAITTTIASNAVTTTKIADSNVTQAKLTGFDYGTLTYSSNVAYVLTGKKVSDSQLLASVSADFILTLTASSAESGCVFNIHLTKSTASLVTITLAGTGITHKGDLGATITTLSLPAGSVGDIYELVGKVRYTGAAIEIDWIINTGSVVQGTGTSTANVMSQDATTSALALKFGNGGNSFTALSSLGSNDTFDVQLLAGGTEKGRMINGAGFRAKGTSTTTAVVFSVVNGSDVVKNEVYGNGNTSLVAAGSFGGGVGTISIGAVTTTPSSNPTATIILYNDAGVAKYRDPSGNIITI